MFIIYSVHFTLYAPYNVRCTMYVVDCTVYHATCVYRSPRVLYTLHQKVLHNTYCTSVYNKAYFTVHSLQCALCTVHWSMIYYTVYNRGNLMMILYDFFRWILLEQSVIHQIIKIITARKNCLNCWSIILKALATLSLALFICVQYTE